MKEKVAAFVLAFLLLPGATGLGAEISGGLLHGEHQAALRHINNGLQDLADKRLYWAKKEFEFVTRMKYDTGLKPVAYLNLGVIHYLEGNIDKAIQHYQKAIELRPQYAEAYFNLGSAHYKRKELKKAEEAYLKAIELQPEYGRAHYSLGILYLEQKKYDLASKHAEKAEEYGVSYKTLKERLNKAGY
ncbi:MAG TPA: tetratricopeptide repeat protein [Candidatus Acidoferrales bacterium]|nr:tetratricopeptide repeat protein [Candidatus Acidoferrales bacterium]